MDTKNSPLVGYVASQLEERAQAGRYPHGSRLPSERELARDLGASRMVVRAAIQVLQNKGVVEHKARCRPIIRTPYQTRPKRTAAERHTLALWLIHRPTDAERSAMLYGIQRSLNPEDYRLLIENAAGECWSAIADAESRFLDRLTREKDVAGAILWYVGGDLNIPLLEKVREHGVPMVFLDRTPPPGFEGDHVGVDNLEGAEHIVRHLIQRGHRRIAHVTNADPASTVRERELGYKRALDAAEIPFKKEYLAAVTGEDSDLKRQCGVLAAQFMALPEPPTAVFVVNDRLAFEMIEAFESMDKRVPEDIAVAGFDGIERLIPGLSKLTTINQPFERIGERAVDLLLRRIHEGSDAPFRHVLLEAHLSIHGSTKPHRADSNHRHRHS